MSTSDVDYLNRATPQLNHDDIQKNAGTEQTAETSDPPVALISNNLSSNKLYSGTLPVTLNPLDNCTTSVNANQFVQVASQGSLEVLTDRSPQQMQMVGTPSLASVINTNMGTMPVALTNEITDITQLGDILNLDQASIGTSSVDNIPLFSILPCAEVMESSGVPSTTTNGGQFYVLTM